MGSLSMAVLEANSLRSLVSLDCLRANSERGWLDSGRHFVWTKTGNQGNPQLMSSGLGNLLFLACLHF